MVLLYVDDILIAFKQLNNVLWFKSEFRKIFKIKDLGEMKKILGINITCNRKARTLCMNQSHYLNNVLEQLDMRSDKHCSTELLMNSYASLYPAGPDDKRTDQWKYQQGIESLMYTAILTHSDIQFPLNRLSQYMSDPAEHHSSALKTLLHYVRSTINLGIVFRRNRSSESSNLMTYSDSDYAANKLNWKSILGYKLKLTDALIAWMSWKQASVATFTTEAKYMALSTCAKECLWIVQLLRDMNLTKYLEDSLNRVDIKENSKHKADSLTQLIPACFKEDNQASLTLVKEPHIHEWSKHIDVAYHHVQDLYVKNQIRVDFVSSHKMVADGLIKPLPKEAFKRFVSQLRLKVSES